MVKSSTKYLIAIAGALGTVLGIPQIQQLIASSFSQLVANHPNLIAIVGAVSVILSLIHQPAKDAPSVVDSGAVKNSLGMILIVGLAVSIGGCDGFKASVGVHNTVAGGIVLAQDELPGLQAVGIVSAQEDSVIVSYLNGLVGLNAQFASCYTNANQTSLKTNAKFLSCLNIFAAGVADPKELAVFRVLNPKAQAKVQLWVGFITGSINVAITQLGGMTEPTPAIAPSAPTTAEVHDFAKRAIAVGR